MDFKIKARPSSSDSRFLRKGRSKAHSLAYKDSLGPSEGKDKKDSLSEPSSINDELQGDSINSSEARQDNITGDFKIDFIEQCLLNEVPFTPKVVSQFDLVTNGSSANPASLVLMSNASEQGQSRRARQRDSKKDTKIEGKLELKKDKQDAKQESRQDVKQESKQDAKQELKTDARLESKSESKHPSLYSVGLDNSCIAVSSENKLPSQSKLEFDEATGLPLPKKFRKKDFEFYTPKVEVNIAQMERYNTVKEIRVKNWKLEPIYMEILKKCALPQTMLRTLNFWNTGLNKETFSQLLDFLTRFSSLLFLSLDANPDLRTVDISGVLSEGIKLNTLSLRFCQLTDDNLQSLCHQIGSTEKWNSTLETLILSNNCIGDSGCEYMAQALKTNRTLRVLNLANNRITCKGAKVLATVLSQFMLTHEEVVVRRQFVFQLEGLDSFSANNSPTHSRHNSQPEVVINAGADKKRKSKKDSSRKNKGKDKESDKLLDKEKIISRRMSSLQQQQQHAKTSKGRGNRLSPAGKNKISTTEWKPLHPLTIDLAYKDGKIVCPGNRVLMSLNLSRNQIGNSGMLSLLEMIRVQQFLNSSLSDNYTGLKRLVLFNNYPGDLSPAYESIKGIMKKLDLLNRTPLLSLEKASTTPCTMPPMIY